ncbi:unnamed protein product [Prorocentrum cordatum]|uniref:Uncharacterized protein n=1 Tax=Prorocentrum cordatum TaxID=2364126 RepID=A0ABN9Y5V5_9DINO|nr:unnamed protein product [Polarella glacialis]
MLTGKREGRKKGPGWDGANSLFGCMVVRMNTGKKAREGESSSQASTWGNPVLLDKGEPTGFNINAMGRRLASIVPKPGTRQNMTGHVRAWAPPTVLRVRRQDAGKKKWSRSVLKCDVTYTCIQFLWATKTIPTPTGETLAPPGNLPTLMGTGTVSFGFRSTHPYLEGARWESQVTLHGGGGMILTMMALVPRIPIREQGGDEAATGGHGAKPRGARPVHEAAAWPTPAWQHVEVRETLEGANLHRLCNTIGRCCAMLTESPCEQNAARKLRYTGAGSPWLCHLPLRNTHVGLELSNPHAACQPSSRPAMAGTRSKPHKHSQHTSGDRGGAGRHLRDCRTHVPMTCTCPRQTYAKSAPYPVNLLTNAFVVVLCLR